MWNSNNINKTSLHDFETANLIIIIQKLITQEF